MRLHDHLGSCVVEILIDSGSTYNFMDYEAVKEAWVKTQRGNRLRVCITNWEKIITHESGQEKVKIQWFKFPISFHVLPLGACELVLGVQWLRTLGSVMWDFVDMLMGFQWEGQSIKWPGLSPSNLHVMLGDKSLKPDFVNKQSRLLQLMLTNKEPIKPCELEKISALFKEFASVF